MIPCPAICIISTVILPVFLVMFYPITTASALIFIPNNESLPTTPTGNTTAVAGAKQLVALPAVASDPIAVGDTQHIMIQVRQANSSIAKAIQGAKVSGAIVNSSESGHAMQLLSANSTVSLISLGQIFYGVTGSKGTYDYYWTIGPQVKIGLYSVVVHVSAEGFTPHQAARQFLVRLK